MDSFKPELMSAPLSIPEQGMYDRQAFEREKGVRDERFSHRLLNLLAQTVGEEYAWVRTSNKDEQGELAHAMLEIKQHQETIRIQTGVYPEGRETYRSLRHRYQQEAGSKAILLTEALMHGDIRNGTLPILSRQDIHL